ncbi:MAG: right-handed parallel beta-helix repeat-containing protein [Anaerolineales bacterium]|nr:MAG: right-handed parallel beta-helix repeat-containing protein [Anaerolineales bacterium]
MVAHANLATAYASSAPYASADPAAAGVIWNTDITTDTTWTLASSPYQVIADINVAESATLIIEPGVEVRFEQYDGLTVQGTLLAVGTPTQPITFTHIATSTWDGIHIQGTSGNINQGSVLDYVTIEYGGDWYANLKLSYAEVAISHSRLSDSSDDGIFASNGSVAHISDTSFTSNSGYAVIFSDGSVNPVLANLTATDNGYDGVAIGSGTLTGNHTWENMSLPYFGVGDIYIAQGSTLTVEPDVEVRFEQYDGLTVQGTLLAVGTPTQPITFTRIATSTWDGIQIQGASGNINQGSVLDYVTIEYGGDWYANLKLSYAKVAVYHSKLRNSSGDGVYTSNAGGSVFEASQIEGNTGYGIQNKSTDFILAANNWWGDPSGPQHGPCNAGGTGDQVSDYVEYLPFLTSPNQDPGLLTPGEARLLSMRPLRWFAPADGSTQVWVEITLRDGNGQPLPGRTVRLNSTRGTTVDGGVTDAKGQTFAYVKSSAAGDALLSAALDAATTCEAARSNSAKVTFTATDAGNLTPGAEAPYLNSQLEIDPLPVMRGVPTTLRVRLTNPNDFPILINGSFSFAQLGIGLVFGPLGTVVDEVIPANSDRTFEVLWTPSVSEHYCVRFEYTWQAQGSEVTAATGPPRRTQRNLSVYSGPLGSSEASGEKEQLERTDKAFNAFSTVTTVAGGSDQSTFVPGWMVGEWWNWTKGMASEISKALGGDPPRQDYDTIATPQKPPVPPMQPDANISANLANAHNALVDSLLDVIAYGEAATISLDRYGGAAAASDLHWSSQQAAALIYFKQKMGEAYLQAAAKQDAFTQALKDEGYTQAPVTVADAQAYQAILSTQGFDAQDIQHAKLLGWTDAEIEALSQAIIAEDSANLTGDILQILAEDADLMRELGNVLMNPPNFPPASGVTASASSNNLVRVFKSVSTFQVRNPLTGTATIDLRIRQLDMPPDWMVNVDPAAATLAPGEQMTATISIKPGTATVQGTQPRVAVEGYAGSELIGGVVVDVMVPEAAALAFGGEQRVYLPIILQDP